MRQQPSQPRDAQSRGADMAPLPAKAAALSRKAIIRRKYDRTAAKKLGNLLTRRFQYGPTDGTVPNIKCEM
jgi:hypothetical protein